MNKPRFLLLAAMIIAAALSRLIPHPPNFSPIAALALFGGSQFASRRAAFAVPLFAMFLSDLILGFGFGVMSAIIYGCFALIVSLGFWVRKNLGIARIAGAALAGSLLFFLVTNFSVWVLSTMYPKSIEGLLACFVVAIPFFWNTLVGDFFYASALFGILWSAEWIMPTLREPAIQPA